MFALKILNSQVSYGYDVIEVKENITNSEAFMKINGDTIERFSLDTPYYKITGKNAYLPSKEINLADVKSFLYSAIKNIIREDKYPILSVSNEGVVYDFSVLDREVKVTEKTLNGVHILASVLQKPLLNAPVNLPLPPWVTPFNLVSAMISLQEKPKDVLKKHFQQVTKIETDSGYIEKSGLKLIRFYHEGAKKVLCYTRMLEYVCFEDTGTVNEVRISDKDAENIINDIIYDYGKCVVEKGMILI
ncbi:hypothetical protein [Stygiolobus caldivivus]|uniref:Uncharacterized protein n=1 Tax=Stygiolobus caldivivus TaxID=2824673 RepID=A0A8D5U8Q3_9CREN|nr:hypothetical protein [Stygiolobus caldivivus]BCU71105.1 hypothetical protein KN1_24020 [Stygiolobus caldivivus]